MTYTAVDDSALNFPPRHRQTTVTYTASGGNYAGVTHQVLFAAVDDEPMRFTVDEGLSYNLRFDRVVTQGCTPVVITMLSSDASVLSVDPTTLSWTEQDSGTPKTVTMTFHDNDAVGEGRVTLRRRLTRPCGGGIPPQDIIFTVRDNDMWSLSVEGIPACGAPVTDTSVEPRTTLVLEPAPAAELETEYRWVTDTAQGQWRAALPIGTSGRSIAATHARLADLRAAYAGFAGFEFRLKDEPDVTAQCTWPFTGDGDDDGSTPAVRLSASPNPVTEGSSVTVTARLSSALVGDVTIPLSLANVTAEDGDYGSLASITISAGQTTGTGTISTAEDDDTDDETFTVALGSLPSSVTAGSPSSVTVTIADDDGGGTTPTTPTTPTTATTPTVRLSASPNPVDEGDPVTVTATLSSALGSAVTVPLTPAAGTAEPGDYGTLSSITISAGQTTGTGTISTAEDDDTDDETFTVALGSLPSSVTAGSPSSATVTIRDTTPSNRLPTVEVSCDPCEVSPDGEVRLTATASDPDGDPLRYRWSAPRGAFMGASDEAAARWRAPAETGRVAVRVEVSDGWSGAAATVSVQVTNAPPAFGQPSYTFELRENEDGRRRAVALGAVVAEDPDGDEVSYSLVGGVAERFAVGARDGTVTYVGAGEDYEREPNRYELTLRARDPHGAEARTQVVVEVTNVNEPPAAEDDEAATAEDARVVIDVLANDTDPDGDGLRVESVSKPAHGTARAAAGGVAYTPEADYHGTDRFTYVASDGNGGTAEAAVEVTVAPVNDAPRAVGAIPDQTLDEGGSGSEVGVSPYFEDIDGDALTYRASSSDPDVVMVSVAGALMTLTPVVYGSAVVTVTAEDPEGATAEQTLAVGVSDRLVRAVVGDTLAAMARSHLASARMTLRRRVEALGGDGGSRLTVLGRAVPLDETAARTAAERVLAGWSSSAGRHGGWRGWPGAARPPGYGATGPGPTSPGGAPGPPGVAMGPNGFGLAGGAGGVTPGDMRAFDAFGGLGGFGDGDGPVAGLGVPTGPGRRRDGPREAAGPALASVGPGRQADVPARAVGGGDVRRRAEHGPPGSGHAAVGALAGGGGGLAQPWGGSMAGPARRSGR